MDTNYKKVGWGGRGGGQIKADTQTPKTNINQLPGNRQRQKEDRRRMKKGRWGIKGWKKRSKRRRKGACLAECAFQRAGVGGGVGGGLSP